MLSGLLAAIYIVAAFCTGGAEVGFNIGMFAILPLACIWFSEPMGGFAGPVLPLAITSPTPGIWVCIGGWLLLLLPLGIWVANLIALGLKWL